MATRTVRGHRGSKLCFPAAGSEAGSQFRVGFPKEFKRAGLEWHFGFCSDSGFVSVNSRVV